MLQPNTLEGPLISQTFKMKKYCLALDLKEDPQLIAEYEKWHLPENSWPAVQESIRASGIASMEIYRTGNRLFMIIETSDIFDLVKKAANDAANPDVQRWEDLMSRFQQPLPWAGANEKWVAMNRIFRL